MFRNTDKRNNQRNKKIILNVSALALLNKHSSMLILGKRAKNTVDNLMTVLSSNPNLVEQTTTAVSHAIQGTEINFG